MRYPLDKASRNLLEKAVKEARKAAETAAEASLKQLGVDAARAPAHLSHAEQQLRTRLRTHGRQLGDSRQGTSGAQELFRLVEETAYQHWHRMLFARFLAENNLLMYPYPVNPVAVTLEECDEMAKDEGSANGWELASRFASQMLPRIFRIESPVLQLTLPPENQQALEKLISDLPKDIFIAQDSLGWVYQFWQTQKKKEINDSEVKIGSRELPAVTQLFTEPYMVSFLLDNSLGAWWASRTLTADDLKNAQTENELRKKAALQGVSLDYLRFVKDQDGAWTPAAGKFESWPEQLKDFKTLDPCCGSGHFLVAALAMLVPIRMKLEGLSIKEAVDAVFRDNIHGLELDERCVEIAAFNLAFTAWTFPGAEGYRPLPELQVACCGLSVGASKEDWVKFGKRDTNTEIALGWIYDYFKNAPILGSLLNPTKTDAATLIHWEKLSEVMGKALNLEEENEWHEKTVVAQGLVKATQLLSGKYNWVMTNPPFLGRGDQCDVLKEFCNNYYSFARGNLATVFLNRCLEFCSQGGTTCIVLPQNWLFLTSYKHFREKLLIGERWQMIARLGTKGFQTPMWDFNVQLMIIDHSNKNINNSGLFKLEQKERMIRGVDVSEIKTPSEKTKGLINNEIENAEQTKQLENPDAIINFKTQYNVSLLGKFAQSLAGLDNGDTMQFRFLFWEIYKMNETWVFQTNSTEKIGLFEGREHILKWEEGKGNLVECPGARLVNIDFWGCDGIYITRMNKLLATTSLATSWDRNGAFLLPRKNEYMAALWLFCSSKNFRVEVRKINQKLSVSEGTFPKVPFDLDYWTKVAAEKYPNGLPKPYSDDPTQWIFHGHPCGSVIWDEQKKKTAHGSLRYDETVLHIALARLLGYRWPAEQDPAMELAEEQREWVNRCNVLLEYADDDGIVCLPPLRGERSAAERLLDMLIAAYGESWQPDTLQQLLKSVGYDGKTLDNWLKEKFFAGHCKLFQNRPFIWHIWDGLRDGFSVLVNYHKLDRKLLEILIYTYLGDWISRQQQDKGKVDGAEERLAAAGALKKKLELILEGEKGYDIFVRWKPLDQQPAGWEPDLNDGVRLNIRPFIKAGDVKERGAGVLRSCPNIKWDKDRGKDAASAPWFKLGLQYGGKEGDRINDHHLSLEEKRKARVQYNENG